MFLQLGLVVVLTLITSTGAFECKASFPLGTQVPDDELMTAFFIADPNPATGYMSFTVDVGSSDDTISAVLVSNTLSYDTWKSQEIFGKVAMSNLWTYLARITASNLFEIFGHVKMVDQVGSNKPRGVIDLTQLSYSFRDACLDFSTKEEIWPFSCFDADFFCQMNSALQSMVSLVQESYLDFDTWKQIVSMKRLSSVNTMSKLGIDRSTRHYVFNSLFQSATLKYIPEKNQDDVFYHSRIVWESLEELIKGTTSFNSWIRNWNYVGFGEVKEFVTDKCNEDSSSVLGVKYYCKCKTFTEKINSCASLTDVTPCIYDPLVQEYFSRGRFIDYEEWEVLSTIISKTRTVLTSFKDKVTDQDTNGLSTLVSSFSPYVTVDASLCVPDWHKAFDCQDTIICNGVKPSALELDCSGGNTCRMNTMYRFDCMVKDIVTAAQKLNNVVSSGWTNPTVTRAKHDLLIWLSYLPMARYTSIDYDDINSVISSTQTSINDYVTSYDTTGLGNFVDNLPPVTYVPFWAKDAACQSTTIENAYQIFCNLDPIINSVFRFLDSFNNGQQSSVKVLNPTEDYRTKLEQLQLDVATSKITLLTENYVRGLSGELRDNFGALSTYFSELADYDKTKAEADIAYIDGRIVKFNGLITALTEPIQTSFSLVLKIAIVANSVEIVQRVAEVGVAIAQVANPASTILGGSSILDLMDTLNNLAQAGVQSAILGKIGTTHFPDLIDRGKRLGEGFASNIKQQATVKELIAGLKAGDSNMKDKSTTFLELYNNYDPKVLLSNITMYGEKFTAVSDQLCEAAFAGETGAAALVEIGLASNGDCAKISSMIAELITVYEEFYDYQFDLMDSLSDACRAYLAYEKANAMKLIYTSGPRVDQAFLQRSAINTFLVSTMNIWELVTEYCDYLTYTTGGLFHDKCRTAIQAPSHYAVANVISYRPDPLCNINNEDTDYRDIPTAPSSAGDKAYIDLEKLYSGELVTFKIPNYQWLKDQNWVTGRTEKAMYVSRFELFLTPMSGQSEYIVETIVEPSNSNYLKEGGTKYLLPVNGFTTKYKENGRNCVDDPIDNPYALCNPDDLGKLCITSNGLTKSPIQPSIYNEWKVTAVVPEGQSAPNPATTFKLQAGITVCELDLHARKRRDVPKPMKRDLLSQVIKRIETPQRKQKRAAQHCCSSNQYWNGANCASCPSGSSQQLSGYYCE